MRISLLIASFFVLILPEGQETVPSPVQYKVPEGFPVDVIQRYRNRTAALSQSFGAAHVQVPQAAITTTLVWTTQEQPVTVAFLGGTPALRTQIAQTARAWSEVSGVVFDFGPAGTFREWTRQDQSYVAQVRISFDEAGYWSVVGAESVDPSIAASNQPSMNLRGFDQALPSDWQAIVLHEFGHALGFNHEQQNANGHCGDQFRWNDDLGYVKTTNTNGQFVPDASGNHPGIYTVLGGPPNNWKPAQVDFNMKSLPAMVDPRYTAFDPSSVMMYSFPGWMFAVPNSPCQTGENLQLSPLDVGAVALTYGPNSTGSTQSLHAMQSLLHMKHLPVDLKEHLAQRLAQVQ